MTPIEYAKKYHITRQRVYVLIRQNRIPYTEKGTRIIISDNAKQYDKLRQGRRAGAKNKKPYQRPYTALINIPIKCTELLFRTPKGGNHVFLTKNTRKTQATIQAIACQNKIKVKTTICRIITNKDEIIKAVIITILKRP